MAIIVINPYQYAAPIGPSADPYSDYVSLLLHGNGTNGSTTFTDSSSNVHTVTANGDAEISTTQSKFGGASMYFDGSGDYLTLATDSSLDLGAGDFTFELWVYILSQTDDMMVGSSSAYVNVQLFRINTGGNYENLTVYLNSGSVIQIQNSGVTVNSWHHLALTRSGSTVRVFVDGTPVASATNSGSVAVDKIGAFYYQGNLFGSFYVNGYIDDLRVTKGVARYTSNFTPPTAELPDPSDPDFDSVSLLLHGDGTNGSTTFIDSSNNSHTVTPGGDAEISTTQSKFGGASMYFDGDGDYLSIPDDTSLHLGSDDFTFEFWTYLNSTTGDLTNKRTISTDGVQYLYFRVTDGSLLTWITSDGSTWDIAENFGFGNTTLSTGQWYHIALVRNGTEISTYVDGTKSPNTITTSAAIQNGSTYPLVIGADVAYGNYLDGYIDDFRLTQGVARYTSNFTPPTAPFPND